MVPWGKVAERAANSISLKLGDKIFANFSGETIKQIQDLPADKQGELLKIIRKADGADGQSEETLKATLDEVTQYLRNTAQITFTGASALDQGAVTKVAQEFDLFKQVKNYTPDQMIENGTKWIGEQGEAIVREMLQKAGYDDIFAVTNASNHGLDVVARLGDGKYAVFEVKTSARGVFNSLSDRQKDMGDFIKKVTRKASKKEGHYKNISDAAKKDAQELYDEIRTANWTTSQEM